MTGNYEEKWSQEIMRRNYHKKLSASIFHHAKNVGIIGILAYPKNKVVIRSKDLKIIKDHAT